MKISLTVRASSTKTDSALCRPDSAAQEQKLSVTSCFPHKFPQKISALRIYPRVTNLICNHQESKRQNLLSIALLALAQWVPASLLVLLALKPEAQALDLVLAHEVP